jgi:hypothetical protein
MGEQVLLLRKLFRCCRWLQYALTNSHRVQAGVNGCCWWGNGSAAADYVLSPVMVSRLGWTGAVGEGMVLLLFAKLSHLWWCPGWGEQVLLVREWFCCCLLCSLTCDGVQTRVNGCCCRSNSSAAAYWVLRTWVTSLCLILLFCSTCFCFKQWEVHDINYQF